MITVSDARAFADRPTLDTHGFELCTSPINFDPDDESQLAAFLEATATLVKRTCGRAATVVPFHHVQIHTRLDTFGKRGGAVERVHGKKELAEKGVLPKETAAMRGCILNVWRNADVTSPVQEKLLVVLNARTVQPSDMGNYYFVEPGGDSLEYRRQGQNLSLHDTARHS